MTDPSPQQIGNDYYDSLLSLTFNSRPIIESHTNLAQENIYAASEIVKAVEKRIKQAIPSHKLFALYLLDSICKNVKVPYNQMFSVNIYKTFTQTYSLVDDPTRVKMIKLFKTWKDPNPTTGLPWLQSDQLGLIEEFLIKATANNRPPEAQNQPPTQLDGPLNKHSLIKETDDLKNLVNSRLLQMPNDSKATQRFELLQQLKTIINQPKALPQQQLEAVKKQLVSIREDELQRLNTFKQQQQQQQLAQQRSTPPAQGNNNFSPAQLQGLLKIVSPPQNSFAQLNQNQQYQQFLLSQHQQHQQPNQTNNANAQAFFSLMSSMMQQRQGGMTPQTQTQTPTQTPPPTNYPIQQQPQPYQQPTDTNKPSGSSNVLALSNLDFLKGIMNKASSLSPKEEVKLSNEQEPEQQVIIPDNPDEILSKFEMNQQFLNNHKVTPEEVSLIYELKPNQCSNCSKRFPNTEQGTYAKQLHLDWHFRINKKIKSSTSKNIHNRSWFLDNSKWVEFKEDEIIGSLEDNDENKEGGLEINNRIRSRNNDSLTEEDLLKKIVPVPDDSENETVCGVCREFLTGVFDDDTGEWVWRNAIKVKGKVFHYGCWAETKGKNRDRSPERS